MRIWEIWSWLAAFCVFLFLIFHDYLISGVEVLMLVFLADMPSGECSSEDIDSRHEVLRTYLGSNTDIFIQTLTKPEGVSVFYVLSDWWHLMKVLAGPFYCTWPPLPLHFGKGILMYKSLVLWAFTFALQHCQNNGPDNINDTFRNHITSGPVPVELSVGHDSMMLAQAPEIILLFGINLVKFWRCNNAVKDVDFHHQTKRYIFLKTPFNMPYSLLCILLCMLISNL